jgi:2-polyprenyl-6-methoxyphenol hydroxylase-like FAD-dependent oxidoreductase
LATALALGDAGHRVTLLERDATPMPASADEAFTWARRGAPQVRHSNALLARLRNTLRDHAPAVLAELLEAGATEIAFTENLPESLSDRDPRPGDEDLVGLACRRTTFEWVVRKHVLAMPSVELRDGVAVTGLLVSGADAPPHVTGVRTDHGDFVADLVVDASGPRSASATWLADAGVVEPAEEVHPSAIVYLSRFYRLRDGATQPIAEGPIAGDLGFLKFAVFVGDNHTFSVTLAVDADDKDLRTRLAEPESFDRAARQLEVIAPWLDGRSEPITDVHSMAGLRNRKRTFVDDGAPIVTGFVAVGDASVCTNPLYGRGCSLAFVHAYALADVVAAHGSDPRALVLAFDDATSRELDPWFKAAVRQDNEARALIESNGATASDDGTVDPQAFMRSVFREGLLPALRTSPVVFRAFLRWFNLLADPNALMSDGEVVAAVFAEYERRHEREPEPAFGPDRDHFLAALAQPA